MDEFVKSESKSVKANGIDVHYLERGVVGAPTVVMFHAIGMSAQIWNAIAIGLSDGFHVYSFDLRGHGDTKDDGNHYTFEKLGEDAAAVIKELNLEGSIGIGHSAGGMAMLIADSMNPGIVSKGVLVDTRVGESPMMLLTPEEQKIRIERTLQKRTIWESRDVMHEAYRDRRVFKPWEDRVFSDYIEGGTRLLEDGRAELKCLPTTEETFYGSRAKLEPQILLKGLGGEYILLVGDYDGAQTVQDAAVQHLMRETKGFQLKELGAGSHFVPMEFPDLVLKEIKAFIS